MFHQVEGLVIDKGSHLGHMKWILREFCKAFFEVDDVKMRFRPSFFPFTEPSLEVDIQCRRTKDEVRFGEGEDWMEILGCGMVHPNVLRNCGLDPDDYQGFAWGMGIDRIAMLKYGIADLRQMFEADVRWLSHYGFRPLDVPTLAGGCRMMRSSQHASRGSVRRHRPRGRIARAGASAEDATCTTPMTHPAGRLDRATAVKAEITWTYDEVTRLCARRRRRPSLDYWRDAHRRISAASFAKT